MRQRVGIIPAVTDMSRFASTALSYAILGRLATSQPVPPQRLNHHRHSGAAIEGGGRDEAAMPVLAPVITTCLKTFGKGTAGRVI